MGFEEFLHWWDVGMSIEALLDEAVAARVRGDKVAATAAAAAAAEEAEGGGEGAAREEKAEQLASDMGDDGRSKTRPKRQSRLLKKSEELPAPVGQGAAGGGEGLEC